MVSKPGSSARAAERRNDETRRAKTPDSPVRRRWSGLIRMLPERVDTADPPL
jgi:hypothetical protein